MSDRSSGGPLPNLVAPLIVGLITLCIISTTKSQSFRALEDYYFNIGEENILDTRILPDNDDVTIFLYKHEPQSYFFPIKRQEIPVSITVTPCSSPIEWKVFFHPEEPDKQDDDFFLQREGLKKTPNNDNKMRFLHSFEGHAMTTYNTQGHYPKGFLRIMLLVKDGNSKVKVLATSSSQPEQAFPLLPKMSGVDVVANDRTGVTVSWKQSPSHVLLGQRIEYCVSFNPRRNYHTLCELQGDRDGDTLPSWNRNAGFGFAWEDSSRSRVIQLRKTLMNKVKPKRDVHLECVGERHWATVTSLLPRQLYYVDVFAINEFTNRSVAYFGTSVVTLTGVDTVEPIRAGVVYVTKIGGGRTSHQRSYTYELKIRAKKLNLFLQTCGGNVDDVTADVIYDGATVTSVKKVGSFRKVTLKSAEVGSYIIRVTTSSRDESREIKLCVSSRTKKCPYGSVPNNRTVSLVPNNKSQCAPPSLHWNAADRHANYCVYRYDFGIDNRDPRKMENPGLSSLCGMKSLGEQLPRENLLLCHQLSRRNFEKTGKYVTRVVELPQSRTNYTLVLQVTLRQNITIIYDPINVGTQDNRQRCK